MKPLFLGVAIILALLIGAGIGYYLQPTKTTTTTSIETKTTTTTSTETKTTTTASTETPTLSETQIVGAMFCNNAWVCYNPIETVGGAYFTNITVVLDFHQLLRVDDTTRPLCYRSFGIQVNTNIYSGGAWEQLVASLCTEGANESSAGVTDVNIAAPMLWLSPTEPTDPCPGGQWVAIPPGTGGDWVCEGLYETHAPPTIEFGSDYQVPSNGSLVISEAFESNGTIELRQSYVEGGRTINASQGSWFDPVNPYGEITSVGATIVSSGSGGVSIFAPGANLTLRLIPQTNLGSDVGVNWTLGGLPGSTAEASNLTITYVQISSDDEVMGFVS